MNTNTPIHPDWTDLLSGFLDGDLDASTFEAVEGHLAECGDCRRVLEELQGVVHRAGELGEIQPPRDLWAGIAATIQAPAPQPSADAKVIAFPSGGGATRSSATPRAEAPAVGRVVLSRRQLIAASVALVAASSMATWVAGPGLGARGPSGAATTDTGDGQVSMVASAPSPAPDVAAEVAALEATLAEARGRLDPNTVRILERNLAVIEQAIEDSRQALAVDPGNEFLVHHLERVYERKRTYLREAVRATEWAG